LQKVFIRAFFQFGSAIQEGNEPLVHHMELFHCELPATQKVPNYQGPCFAKDKPPILENCKRVLSAWAMGALPFVYPQVRNFSSTF
jgi:dopamine beta-monooxygenase